MRMLSRLAPTNGSDTTAPPFLRGGNASFKPVFLSLSRACLGKSSWVIGKLARKKAFFAPAGLVQCESNL